MISYPLSVPTHNFRSVRFFMEKVSSAVTSPFTLQTQVQEFAGERWAVEVELPPIKGRAAAEAWITFLASLRGMAGTFEMGDPLGSAPRGSVAGTPLTEVTAAQSKELETKGWTPSAVGVLLAGDYVQFTSSGKKYLHKVLADVDADGSGNATVDIWPVTRESLAADVAIVTSDARGTFRLASTNIGWDANYLQLYGVEFKGVEAL